MNAMYKIRYKQTEMQAPQDDWTTIESSGVWAGEEFAFIAERYLKASKDGFVSVLSFFENSKPMSRDNVRLHIEQT